MPNRAALAASDVADSTRMAPAGDLRDYAAARGWEDLGSALAAHFSGLNPLWVDYAFNVVRGELAPERFGVLAHELLQVPAHDGSPEMGGAWFSTRIVINKGLGNLVGFPKEPPDEPFAAHAVWTPTTTVKLLVPEAVLLPKILIRNADRMAWSHPQLGAAAPGFRLRESRWIADPLREALAGAFGPILTALPHPFVELRLVVGSLGLRVNGFPLDPAVLDGLVAAARALAESAAELGRPWWAPAPFAQRIAGFSPEAHPGGYLTFHFDDAFVAQMRAYGDAHGLVEEDPVVLHRAFPRLPIPGASRGVLAGTLPGTSTFGRVTWQYQAHERTSSNMRGGVLVEARPDAPALPVGGWLHPETNVYVEHRDGVAAAWSRSFTTGRLEAEDVVTRALAALHASGVAALT